jgi:hypothetical protein
MVISNTYIYTPGKKFFMVSIVARYIKKHVPVDDFFYSMAPAKVLQ